MQTLTQFAQAFVPVPPEAIFKRNLGGWIVAVLNTLMALMGANFFLGMLKVSVGDWVMMNTCALCIALFVIGYLLGSPVVMTASAVLMFRYGTLGLFVFSWSGGNLIAQAGHAMMTLAVIYVVADIIRHRRWKTLILGQLLGMAILFPLEIAQTMWIVAHPETTAKLFSGNLTLPGQ
jgi:hypothetical protein